MIILLLYITMLPEGVDVDFVAQVFEEVSKGIWKIVFKLTQKKMTVLKLQLCKLELFFALHIEVWLGQIIEY